MTQQKESRTTRTEKNVFTPKNLKISLDGLPVAIPKGKVLIEHTCLVEMIVRPDEVTRPYSVIVVPLSESALVLINDAPWLLIVYPEMVRPKKSKYWHLKGQSRYSRYFKL